MKANRKQKVEFNVDVHGEQLEAMFKEASGLKTQVESANAAIADIRKAAKDELGLKPAQFNKLFRVHHSGTREKFEDESNETMELYDAIFGK